MPTDQRARGKRFLLWDLQRRLMLGEYTILVLNRTILQAKSLPSRVLIPARLHDCWCFLIGGRSKIGHGTLTRVSIHTSQPVVCNSCMPWLNLVLESLRETGGGDFLYTAIEDMFWQTVLLCRGIPDTMFFLCNLPSHGDKFGWRMRGKSSWPGMLNMRKFPWRLMISRSRSVIGQNRHGWSTISSIVWKQIVFLHTRIVRWVHVMLK